MKKQAKTDKKHTPLVLLEMLEKQFNMEFSVQQLEAEKSCWKMLELYIQQPKEKSAELLKCEAEGQQEQVTELLAKYQSIRKIRQAVIVLVDKTRTTGQIRREQGELAGLALSGWTQAESAMQQIITTSATALITNTAEELGKFFPVTNPQTGVLENKKIPQIGKCVAEFNRQYDRLTDANSLTPELQTAKQALKTAETALRAYQEFLEEKQKCFQEQKEDRTAKKSLTTFWQCHKKRGNPNLNSSELPTFSAAPLPTG